MAAIAESVQSTNLSICLHCSSVYHQWIVEYHPRNATFLMYETTSQLSLQSSLHARPCRQSQNTGAICLYCFDHLFVKD